MVTGNKELGQTLIETVFVLALLFLLILGIAEFSRAWYVKNSLNNAARIGARVGAVTPGLAAETDTPCPGGSAVATAVCNSAGVPSTAEVTVAVVDTSGDSVIPNAGDTVTVTVKIDYLTGFSPFAILPWLQSLTDLSSQASMRYE